jgi:hypothetical protein
MGDGHGARETTLQAKATGQSPGGVGRHRFVVLAGEQRIRCTGSKYAAAEHWSEPRNHSRRRGALRRQLGDVLRL